MKTMNIAFLAVSAALLLGVANFVVAEDHEPEPEYFTPPPVPRPCKEVIRGAMEYCEPFVWAIYNQHFVAEGRKAAICMSKVASYQCTAEAICAECSDEESVYFEAQWRDYLERYQKHPVCQQFEDEMKTNGSYCDYLQYVDNGTSTTLETVLETTTAMISKIATESSNATSVSSTPQADESKKSSPTGPTVWPIALIVLLIFALPIAVWYGAKYIRDKMYPPNPYFRMVSMSGQDV